MSFNLSEIQFLSLYVGGIDGGIVQDAASAFTAGEVHLIEILEDDTEFTVLSGKNQDDTARNFITDNNYSGKKWGKGYLVFAPFAGYIDTFTADKDVRYFRIPDTGRKRNEP